MTSDVGGGGAGERRGMRDAAVKEVGADRASRCGQDPEGHKTGGLVQDRGEGGDTLLLSGYRWRDF